jgi:uncharacterized protein (TIGR03000 family)
MFRNVFTFSSLLLLTGAVVLGTAGSGWARGGGGHGGGGHVGGFHGGSFGGYRGGYWGGYRGYGYGGYYPRYGYNRYNVYYGGYPYSYGDSEPYYSSYPYSTSDLNTDSWLSPESAQPEAGDAFNPGPVVQPGDAVETAGYRSLYPPTGDGAAASARQAAAPAGVTVKVPQGAELWFDGSKTRSTGSVREFESPPLTQGRQYTYDVRARWRDNGKDVTQTRRVIVTAGTHADVEFPVRDQTAGAAKLTTAR